MYRLILDTDVLLDAVDPNRPGSADAREILSWCNGSGDMGIAVSASLKDVYRIMRSRYSEAIARRAVQWLTELLVIGPLGIEECLGALASNEPDFEDGLVRSVAELEGADFIITCSTSAFEGSSVKSMTPRAFIHAVISADRRNR